MSYFNYHYRGYKTRTIILIITCSTLIISYLITNYENKRNKVFVDFLLFVSVFITCFLSFINLQGFSDNVWYEDSKYRIENFQYFMTSAEHLPDLYIKEGIFEKRVVLDYGENYHYDYKHHVNINNISTYSISEIKNSVIVIFQFEDGFEIITEAYK